MYLSLAVGLRVLSYLHVHFKSKVSDLFPSFSIGWLFELQIIITVMVSSVHQFQWTTGGPDI